MSLKISLFTPTNNARHLAETYDSLRLQSHRNFEWVLVPNGGLKPEQIPEDIRRDPRVVIRPYEHKHIGALKRFACDQATGDAFVEMDHDDILLPNALEHVAERFREGAGFVYSDVAGFDDGKLTPQRYSPEYGWENYAFRVYNRLLYATRCFKPSARSLCSVHYAPDHVRSWSREAYYKAGGHDPSLLVADDHDLICRSYLAKVPFSHTGYCDYLYRFHGDNTVKKYNDDIQRLQKANQDKYLWKLIDEWLRRNALPFEQLSPKLDWTKPLPYRDNSVGCIKAWDVLQYVPTSQVPFIMTEIYRALIPGGWLCLKAPSTDGRAAWMPGYHSLWNEEIINCFCRRETAEAQVPTYRGRFQQVRCWTACDGDEARRRSLHSLYADLMAVKDERVPGRNYI